MGGPGDETRIGNQEKNMTENRRIFWNILATYGRSLFSLVVGLFTARWALNALGVIDYGLYGVVGGLVVFISFINGTLAGASSRFYAVAIGKARKAADKDGALEECRMWFNTALSIHVLVPVVLLAIGYPIGVWTVKNFLTIPPDRIADCVWVFRFTCLTCFVGMVNVPFSAMYGAKQYIAELTIYSYVTTVLNAGFLYFMVTHPGVWLFRYAVWCCVLSVIPQTIITIRAMFVFPECRIVRKYLWQSGPIKEVASFAGWNLMGVFCQLLRVQGVAILINKAFGPKVNASMALGGSVNGHTSSLAGSLMGAFSPAIETAYGAGDTKRMREMAFRACKFGCLLLLIFFIPLMLELRQVMLIWLKTPPQYVVFLCYVMLLDTFFETSTHGHMVAVNASGRVKEYQINMTMISILTLPIAVVTVWLGGGVYALGLVLVGARISISLRRVYYARKFAGLSGIAWLKEVVAPISLVVLLASAVGTIPLCFMPSGFFRIVLVTLLSELALFPASWFLVLNAEERAFVVEKLRAKFKK